MESLKNSSRLCKSNRTWHHFDMDIPKHTVTNNMDHELNKDAKGPGASHQGTFSGVESTPRMARP